MDRRSFLKWLAAALSLPLLGGLGNAAQRYWESMNKPSILAQSAQSTFTSVVSDDEALMSMYIFSDLHISQDPQTPRKMKQALQDLTSYENLVDALIITGDLTDTGTMSDYRLLSSILSKYKLPPIGANMGNHEYYTIWTDAHGAWKKSTMPNGKTNELSRQQFLTFMNYRKTYNEMTIKGYTVLLLSQETYILEKPEVGEGAWYSDEQLDWLEERLSSVSKDGKPVFVMIHQPLPPEGENGGSHFLIRAKRFREILQPYQNVFVFCGHRHQDFTNGTEHYVKETFHLFHNSSVTRPLDRNYIEIWKDHAQGIYLQVYQNKVIVRGREFSKRSFIKEAYWTIPLQTKSKVLL
ncbi:metallophosphoesterase [Paenibacillus alginolyticus]|uniref:metallophosphoesterase family protein n=1 Tax=Paenibacillus alginolyticus TaxID=59839 RepID=UPI00041D2F0F|nr:metallophosphoesterase [Paenibacillus alginolyticus]MCY9666209.1 metallophosphoesterase [Paenibacillus alginolyticus]